MSKQYGLILPGQQKKKPLLPSPIKGTFRPSIFDESSESDGDEEKSAPPRHLQAKTTTIHQSSAMERRMARRVQEKALKEDPTVFQYDELYDDMDTKREEAKKVKSNEPKKPKYIDRLMKCAERRKLENEMRVERMVQKEREEEGEEFKGKESFVTTSYRKKLEDMRQLEEQEKHDDYLEAIGDVTKQKDLDGFYRYLYEQKVGTSKEVQKPLMSPKTSAGDEEIAYKPVKSNKPPPQKRAYRKRQASADEEDDAVEPLANTVAKKIHLQSNIDADSDFSIDSSSSDDDDEDVTKGKKSPTPKPGTTILQTEVKTEKKEEDHVEANKQQLKTEDAVMPADAVEAPKPKPKIDKEAIWRKRTVGEVYDAAVKRYFERKAKAMRRA